MSYEYPAEVMCEEREVLLEIAAAARRLQPILDHVFLGAIGGQEAEKLRDALARLDEKPTSCEMKHGRCPRHPGHVVTMHPDSFNCSSCGDTGKRPCSCEDCPDRSDR